VTEESVPSNEREERAGGDPPKVASVVLNYNGRDVTLEALGSLTQLNYPNYDLIVVDNGSTDGSYEAIAEAFPDVIQVRTEQNLWASGGMNLGLVYALERDYDYLLLLNNDIETDPEMLTEMVKVCEADPSVGCVGPKSYYFWDRDRIWSAGGILRFKESGSKERGMGDIDNGQWDRDEEVDYINGCAMLVPAKVMREVGLWDPVYRLALEDADWCMRMKRLGYRSWYSHRAVLWHMVSHTAGGYKAGRTFQTGRSAAIFVRKYGGPWQWLTFVAFMCAALPLAFLRELPKGNQSAVTAKMKGVLAGLRVPLPEPPAAPPTPDGAESATPAVPAPG
jgi:GT2 family glycosyltransferase